MVLKGYTTPPINSEEKILKDLYMDCMHKKCLNALPCQNFHVNDIFNKKFEKFLIKN